MNDTTEPTTAAPSTETPLAGEVIRRYAGFPSGKGGAGVRGVWLRPMGEGALSLAREIIDRWGRRGEPSAGVTLPFREGVRRKETSPEVGIHSDPLDIGPVAPQRRDRGGTVARSLSRALSGDAELPPDVSHAAPLRGAGAEPEKRAGSSVAQAPVKKISTRRGEGGAALSRTEERRIVGIAVSPTAHFSTGHRHDDAVSGETTAGGTDAAALPVALPPVPPLPAGTGAAGIARKEGAPGALPVVRVGAGRANRAAALSPEPGRMPPPAEAVRVRRAVSLHGPVEGAAVDSPLSSVSAAPPRSLFRSPAGVQAGAAQGGGGSATTSVPVSASETGRGTDHVEPDSHLPRPSGGGRPYILRKLSPGADSGGESRGVAGVSPFGGSRLVAPGSAGIVRSFDDGGGAEGVSPLTLSRSAGSLPLSGGTAGYCPDPSGPESTLGSALRHAVEIHGRSDSATLPVRVGRGVPGTGSRSAGTPEVARWTAKGAGTIMPALKAVPSGAAGRQGESGSPTIAGVWGAADKVAQRAAEQIGTPETVPPPSDPSQSPRPTEGSTGTASVALIEGPALERLADRVYAVIEQRLIVEKERRGL